MGWWPFGHVLRGRNPQLWHETASNHPRDFRLHTRSRPCSLGVCHLPLRRWARYRVGVGAPGSSPMKAHRVALALAQPLIERVRCRQSAPGPVGILFHIASEAFMLSFPLMKRWQGFTLLLLTIQVPAFAEGIDFNTWSF